MIQIYDFVYSRGFAAGMLLIALCTLLVAGLQNVAEPEPQPPAPVRRGRRP